MTNDHIRQLIQHLEELKMSGVDVVPVSKQASEPSFEKFAVNQNSMVVDASIETEFPAFKQEVEQCVKCSELASRRSHVVFGSGNTAAELVFVGEAPGFDEDQQGLPFVGQAGQLLTKIIEAIGLKRAEVFICNVLKCRPPGNRNPHPSEISNCSPYLLKQLDLIRPKIICALGTFAAQTLLKTDKPISSLRGRFYEFRGAQLICTFHPAYLLRNPGEKRKVWEDMKMIRTELSRV